MFKINDKVKFCTEYHPSLNNKIGKIFDVTDKFVYVVIENKLDKFDLIWAKNNLKIINNSFNKSKFIPLNQF